MEDDIMNIQIGYRIRTLRELHNYTREELAEKADISAKFLYEIEFGKKGFSADTLCRLSQALSASCDYIMLGSTNSSSYNNVSLPEALPPLQLTRILNILNILYEMCDGNNNR